MKLSIIIPVYNEAATVAELLDLVLDQRLPTPLSREIIVVESCSTDGSREIVQNFSRGSEKNYPGEVKTIWQAAPQGKGAAVREGLAAATGDIILIQDADLEYDVKDYPALLEPILEGKTDFVLGSRHLSVGTWKIRIFEKNRFRSWLMNLGGFFFHTFFNLLYQQRLTDPTTMFKVFRRSALKNIELVSNRFDFDFELLAKLIRTGHPPLEVPISYRSRNFEEGKKIRFFRDPPTWIAAIVRFRFSRIYRSV